MSASNAGTIGNHVIDVTNHFGVRCFIQSLDLWLTRHLSMNLDYSQFCIPSSNIALSLNIKKTTSEYVYIIYTVYIYNMRWPSPSKKFVPSNHFLSPGVPGGKGKPS